MKISLQNFIVDVDRMGGSRFKKRKRLNALKGELKSTFCRNKFNKNTIKEKVL